MAISLNKVTKSSKKLKLARKKVSEVKTKFVERKVTETVAAKQALQKTAARPWTAKANLDFKIFSLSLAELYSEVELPHSIDLSAVNNLAPQSLRPLAEELWQNCQQKNYILSRLTHRRSWLARLKIFPRLVIPIPNWLVQVGVNEPTES